MGKPRKPKQRRKPKPIKTPVTHDPPVSLHPIKFGDAVAALLKAPKS